MSSYDQGYTCIECEHSYDDRDGDLDERMCNECIDTIYEQEKKATVDIDLHGKESKEIHGKIMAILKRCNLYDLRTIFETLAEMGFKEKS